MPTGGMLPVRNMSSFGGHNENVGLFGSSSSGLSLAQGNLLDMEGGGQLQQLELLQNTSDSEFAMRLREEDLFEHDSTNNRSGSENQEGIASGDDLENTRPNKKKRYHRHTQHQIQEMEAFFKECPHPDDKQRKELSRELALEPLQVKFWFQNKRTQMKTQQERHENTALRCDNEKLRADNIRYREALNNASCPNCGGPTALGEMSFDEHHLRMENARLRDEIDRISGIAAKYVGKGMTSYPLFPSPMSQRSLEMGVGNYGIGGDMYGPGEVMRSVATPNEADKPVIIELAVGAMEELLRMSQMGDPLWMTSLDGSMAVLNEEEYEKTFPRTASNKPLSFKTEASRESAIVIINHVNLVEILMDADRWTNMFSGIVSRAMTMEVLSTGIAGHYDGALQVMSAEYQVPTPLVPTRESYFVRYCKQHSDGIWAVIDVSLDNLRPSSTVRCRRRPSGCIIQEMPNGYSKVTWIEHVEVDDRGVHDLYKQIVGTGHAFGAKRWISNLDRQCQRLASLMATNLLTGDVSVLTSSDGKKSMLKLAERMVISFCNGVSASTSQTWTTLSGTGADDVRVMTRKSVDDPGRPPGIVLSAATSFWLPVPPKRVFDFLRDENTRSEWDILSNGGLVSEMTHIANGLDTGNCVSLLRVNTAGANQSNMLIIQESFTDATESFVIYAPVDILAMNVVLNGGDPEYVALLPSGFAILPDGSNPLGSGGNGDPAGGSLLTVAFQILVDSIPTAKLSLGSVATVNNLIGCTVGRIKSSLAPNDASTTNLS